jgi:hypothetical protein
VISSLKINIHVRDPQPSAESMPLEEQVICPECCRHLRDYIEGYVLWDGKARGIELRAYKGNCGHCGEATETVQFRREGSEVWHVQRWRRVGSRSWDIVTPLPGNQRA